MVTSHITHFRACVPHFISQSDPAMIKDIINAVTIPVMAKVRIGHFVEAQVRLVRVRSSFISLILAPSDPR